jgi:hypothetical protein
MTEQVSFLLFDSREKSKLSLIVNEVISDHQSIVLMVAVPNLKILKNGVNFLTCVYCTANCSACQYILDKQDAFLR